MNEFIVWDKILEYFILDCELKLEDGKLVPYGEDFSIFPYVGEKDIDGRKIYADCSIVNMTYSDARYNHRVSVTGFFCYNNDKKCLEFIIFNERSINFVLHISYIVSLKVIDTIQQNELGLIK